MDHCSFGLGSSYNEKDIDVAGRIWSRREWHVVLSASGEHALHEHTMSTQKCPHATHHAAERTDATGGSV
eukprot:2955185-Amphidinium_carterae.1